MPASDSRRSVEGQPGEKCRTTETGKNWIGSRPRFRPSTGSRCRKSRRRRRRGRLETRQHDANARNMITNVRNVTQMRAIWRKCPQWRMRQLKACCYWRHFESVIFEAAVRLPEESTLRASKASVQLFWASSLLGLKRLSSRWVRPLGHSDKEL